MYRDRSATKEFRWRLVANNGEAILKTTEGYTTKQNCELSIASSKKNSKDENKYRKGQTTIGYYFILVAENGEELGQSEYYSTPSNRDQGIQTCMHVATTATVDDRT